MCSALKLGALVLSHPLLIVATSSPSSLSAGILRKCGGDRRLQDDVVGALGRLACRRRRFSPCTRPSWAIRRAALFAHARASTGTRDNALAPRRLLQPPRAIGRLLARPLTWPLPLAPLAPPNALPRRFGVGCGAGARVCAAVSTRAQYSRVELLSTPGVLEVGGARGAITTGPLTAFGPLAGVAQSAS